MKRGFLIPLTNQMQDLLASVKVAFAKHGRYLEKLAIQAYKSKFYPIICKAKFRQILPILKVEINFLLLLFQNQVSHCRQWGI